MRIKLYDSRDVFCCGISTSPEQSLETKIIALLRQKSAKNVEAHQNLTKSLDEVSG
jgi:hypothetical protein